MVCESEPDAPWGLLIITSVRETQTDRRREVAVLVCFTWPCFTTRYLLDLMREEMMLYWAVFVMLHCLHIGHINRSEGYSCLVCMFWIFHPHGKKNHKWDLGWDLRKRKKAASAGSIRRQQVTSSLSITIWSIFWIFSDISLSRAFDSMKVKIKNYSIKKKMKWSLKVPFDSQFVWKCAFLTNFFSPFLWEPFFFHWYCSKIFLKYLLKHHLSIIRSYAPSEAFWKSILGDIFNVANVACKVMLPDRAAKQKAYCLCFRSQPLLIFQLFSSWTRGNQFPAEFSYNPHYCKAKHTWTR